VWVDDPDLHKRTRDVSLFAEGNIVFRKAPVTQYLRQKVSWRHSALYPSYNFSQIRL